MKKLISSILFLFCVSSILAQTSTEDYYAPSKPKLLPQDRITTSISAGAGLSFLNSTKAPVYTTFIAAKVGYQLTTKFKLNVGLMHYTATGNTFMPLNQYEIVYNRSNKTVSGNLLFIEGQYQLNTRLIVSGAVIADANGFNANKQNNYKAASFGLDYKLSEHSTIGFRATVSQGSTDYYLNPRTNTFEYSPYANSIQNAVFGFGQWGAGQLNSFTK